MGPIFLAPPVPGSWVVADRRGLEQGRSVLSKNLKVEPEKGVGELEAPWEAGTRLCSYLSRDKGQEPPFP